MEMEIEIEMGCGRGVEFVPVVAQLAERRTVVCQLSLGRWFKSAQPESHFTPKITFSSSIYLLTLCK